MSHIPSSAMKHAGPIHHDEAPAPEQARKPKASVTEGGIGTRAWIAIGGTLLAGAAAAIAVPLLRGRAAPVATRHGKKATPRKAKARKAADA